MLWPAAPRHDSTQFDPGVTRSGSKGRSKRTGEPRARERTSPRPAGELGTEDVARGDIHLIHRRQGHDRRSRGYRPFTCRHCRTAAGVRTPGRFRRLSTTTVIALTLITAVSSAVIASRSFPSDVPESNQFHGSISWLADNDVTMGCNPPAFDACPADDVSREQMASFMRRFAQTMGMASDEAVGASAVRPQDPDPVLIGHRASSCGLGRRARSRNLPSRQDATGRRAEARLAALCWSPVSDQEVGAQVAVNARVDAVASGEPSVRSTQST